MTKVNKIHQHHLLVNISFFKLKSNWELSCQQGQEKSSYKNVLYTILDNLCWDYNIENPVDDFDFIYIFIVFELCFLLLLNIQQVTLWNPPLTVVMHGILANYLQTMFWSVSLPKVVHIVEFLNHVIFPAKYKYRKLWMYHISVFMFDLNIIHMTCEYDWYWTISACSTEYEVCDWFASLTSQQASYSGSSVWYFRYQSIHFQIT
jgi:hypothetical protein